MVTINDITMALQHHFGERVTPDSLRDLSRADGTVQAARQIGIWIGVKNDVPNDALASTFGVHNGDIEQAVRAAIHRSDDDHLFSGDAIGISERLGINPFRLG